MDHCGNREKVEKQTKTVVIGIPTSFVIKFSIQHVLLGVLLESKTFSKLVDEGSQPSRS